MNPLILDVANKVSTEVAAQLDIFVGEVIGRFIGHEVLDMYKEQRKQIPELELGVHQLGHFPRIVFDATITYKGRVMARRRFTTIPSPSGASIIKQEDMKTRILITGAAGFIGHHIVEHILKVTDWDIVVLDKLTYASNGYDRLRDIEVFKEHAHRVTVFTCDISNPIEDGLLAEIGQVDYILHMGAETHVDNSIKDPRRFVVANVLGTLEILNLARQMSGLKRFIYFSTDEVFGPAPDGHAFREWDRYASGNPYSATKAGGEELALAFANTYKLPVIVTHTMNVFGERQHPEKFIPMCVKKILKGETTTIRANATRTEAGSRFWIHARNVADAIMFLLKSDKIVPDIEMHAGEPLKMPVSKFNIVGEQEVDNLQMAQMIHKILTELGLTSGDLKYEMVDFHSSRPGHDLRYALDGSKMAMLGWKPPMGFEDTMRRTIKWMVSHNHNRWMI